MHISTNKLILLLFITLTTFCSMTFEEENRVSINNHFKQTPKIQSTPNSKMLRAQARYPRQNNVAKKPPGLFVAVNSLIGGTIVDLFTGFRNFTTKIQTAFNPPKSTSLNNNTSTTPRTNVRQVIGIITSNFRSLRKTFDNEFTKALNDSEKNFLEFRKELKNSKKLTVEY